jgi:primosomal protein N' (replication factor Y)
MQALLQGDRDAFMAAELKEREAYRLPPAWRLASITVSGEDAAQVIRLANALAAQAPQDKKLRVLGPAPAPFAMLRGRYRHRMLIQAPINVNLSLVVRQWIARVPTPRNIRVLVDIDPYSFL